MWIKFGIKIMFFVYVNGLYAMRFASFNKKMKEIIYGLPSRFSWQLKGTGN